ncbi:hypothetical protein [Brevundimonas balnearis]|uniref:Uncharacterized protein n=1 Tax=Brevundimonas balnearis TaxID=1572858 RepID=A0ABV6R0F9_9CAUL
MTRILFAAVLMAGLPAVAAAQTPPAGSSRTAEELTRDLNSGPPFVAPPVQRPAATPAATAAETPPAPTSSTTAPTSPPDEIRLVGRPPNLPPGNGRLAPEAEAPAAEPAAPGPIPLDAAARARLPFTLALPAGTEIVETPSGPSFDTWAVRRGETTLVRLYAGPASQFPVYGGEIRTLNGRSTVVVTEGTARRALEHLFERDGMTPREIHVMVATLSGPDQALAESIGQSVDPR